MTKVGIRLEDSQSPGWLASSDLVQIDDLDRWFPLSLPITIPLKNLN